MLLFVKLQGWALNGIPMNKKEESGICVGKLKLVTL